ncbi:MAG: DUF2971 domain-containing protein [Oscillospiraceae bacterium]
MPHIKVPKLVYHYCNLPVFRSIIENQTIRLTDKCYDILKLRHFYDDPQNLTSTLQKMNLIGNAPESLEKPFNKTKALLDDAVVFACCFSLYGDCAEDWHYAEQGNGVCLGFDTDVLAKLSPYLRFKYVDPIKSSEFDALPIVPTDKLTPALLSEFVANKTAFAKFDGSPDERSFRLVYIGSRQTGTDEISDFAQFRGAMTNRVGESVEFFDIKLPMDSILKEIYIGPNCKPAEVKMLFDQFGISESKIRIINSKL